MLTLRGTAKNIETTLLGRVSLSPVRKEERSKTIIVNPDPKIEGLEGYVGLVCSIRENRINPGNNNVPMVCEVGGIETLSEGDVIELSPQGIITVLYEVNSRHNLIFVTSKCDSNCIMCPQPVDENEGNLTELNLKLISLISTETQELALTGGEPTLVGDHLFRLILACRDLLPKTSLLLLTNGRKFCDFEYARFFSSLRHPNIIAGVPLCGDNDHEHDAIMGARGAFDQTIRGILNVASFGVSIEIRIVIHRFTYEKLPRLAEFIYRNLTFTRHIAFMGIEMTGHAVKNADRLWVEPNKFVEPLKDAIHFLVQRGMAASIYNIPLCILPKSLRRFAKQSISEWKDVFDESCRGCGIKENCSGIFDSTIELYRRHLTPQASD